MSAKHRDDRGGVDDGGALVAAHEEGIKMNKTEIKRKKEKF